MNNLTQYLFQNRTPLTLKSERWKDIPGFEGSYQVSNLGRVKSLDRFVPHNRCGKQFVKGRILRQNIKKHYNHFTEDYMVILQVTLMLENRRYEFSVRRLVYAAFKDPSVLSNNKRMVVSKDGDGYNCWRFRQKYTTLSLQSIPREVRRTGGFKAKYFSFSLTILL